MSRSLLEEVVTDLCQLVNGDSSRLLDVVVPLQRRFGCVSDEGIELISRELAVPRVEVESAVSFYSFLSFKPAGKVVIRLCNDIIDRFNGMDRVARVFEEELGIRVGETTADGRISLVWTACIGMSDQAPAALVNEVVLTRLSTDSAREAVRDLKRHMDPSLLVTHLGDGNNAHELVSAMVENNIRQRGPVIFTPMEPGTALRKALAMTPAEIIRNLKTARLRGRGGAGFPTGMKWEFARAARGARKFVVCNADEGEPGTFKDRVILTECPDLMFEGMAIAGFALGASEGILYLRGEYQYLRTFLESRLEWLRGHSLLGENICGFAGFDFDIRIQLGAGAYVCGEETALLSSCEGTRGVPKNRPPFPAQEGYLGFPTSVNNVETFCCAARIVEHGPGWFSELGSDRSSGTKLLSISGDCRRPGVYEVPLGIALEEMLRIAGGEGAKAVQVGGPSGQMVGPEQFGRPICFDELSTGGSVMVFGPGRDLLEVVAAFQHFFVEESCGYCTPCRVGGVLLLRAIEEIRAGKAGPGTLEYLSDLGRGVRAASRCGLGQTCANPVLSTLDRFRSEYESRIVPLKDRQKASFDLEMAVRQASEISGRRDVCESGGVRG